RVPAVRLALHQPQVHRGVRRKHEDCARYLGRGSHQIPPSITAMANSLTRTGSATEACLRIGMEVRTPLRITSRGARRPEPSAQRAIPERLATTWPCVSQADISRAAEVLPACLTQAFAIPGARAKAMRASSAERLIKPSGPTTFSTRVEPGVP